MPGPCAGLGLPLSVCTRALMLVLPCSCVTGPQSTLSIVRGWLVLVNLGAPRVTSPAHWAHLETETSVFCRSSAVRTFILPGSLESLGSTEDQHRPECRESQGWVGRLRTDFYSPAAGVVKFTTLPLARKLSGAECHLFVTASTRVPVGDGFSFPASL